jgi:hypothetical protein
MRFKWLKNIFAGAVYLLCLWSILATSQLEKSIDNSHLTATSDCVNPVMAVSITTANGMITSPASTAWTDFGFPAAQVFLGSDISGLVNGVNRTCTRTYGDTVSSDEWIYSCFESDKYICAILIQQN